MSQDPGDTFSKSYEIGAELGAGKYSVVYAGVSKKDGQRVAIKAYQRAKLTPRDLDNIRHEVTILRSLDHPNVLKMHEFCMDKDHFYVVMEFLEGGELFASIVERERYSEADAQGVLRSLGEALTYCHARKVAHRDLKPENILLSSPNAPDAVIKLCDFGFSKEVSEEDQLKTALGTAQYMAPEILRRESYDIAVDMWAFGVIAYILLCGYPPFFDDNQRVLFEKIKAGKYEFDDKYWSNVSESAKELIRNLLVVDPSKRYTIQQVMSDPWMTATLKEKDITPAIDMLKSQLVKRKLKAGVRTFMAIEKMKKLTGGGD